MSIEYKILSQSLFSYSQADSLTFLAVRQSGTGIDKLTGAAYSTDGSEWRTSLLPESGYWQSVTYGDGKFVAVTYYSPTSELSASSTDGITWTTSASLPISSSWQSVTYGDGKFVAVAYTSNTGESSAYSTDGITWTLSDLPNSSWQSVTYGDGKFVAVATNGNTGQLSAYSTDGITWTSSDLTGTWWYSVTYGDGKFVAISTSGNQNEYSAYSTDGVTWTLSNIPAASWYSVAYGNGKFLAVAGSGDYGYSTDGIDWTLSVIPGFHSWQSVAYGDGKFVAVSGNTFAAYSTDGITWTLSDLPKDNWKSVTYGYGVGLTVIIPTVIYEVPEDRQATATSIFISNNKNFDVSYDLAVIPQGEELSLKHYLRRNMTISSKDFELLSTKITMSSGDRVELYSNSIDSLSITMFGAEYL